MSYAVVLGATGATGRELVGQLLSSGKWSKVATVGRRAVEVPEAYKGYTPEKLQQHVVNMDNLATEAGEAFRGAHTVFCTLGTTRKVAGSADNFRKVDLHYVEAAAKAAKAAGVPHFSLLTAQGANPNVCASDLAPLHPLLYTKTKGQAEEAVKAQGFARVSIFRPGMLVRPGSERLVERVFAALPVPKLQVGDLAKVMIAEAEKATEGVQVYEMKTIQKLAKKNVAA
jgi:oxidoreductase